MKSNARVVIPIAFIVLIGLGAAFISCRSNPDKASPDKTDRDTVKSNTSTAVETVTSKDGTRIAYNKVGQGPALIIVGGAFSTRSSGVELAQQLAPHFTVYSYDRRGRGESTDTKPYSFPKEIEDIEAIISKAGGPAYVYGVSSGACLALETASLLGEKVKKLAIYEPPYDEAIGAAQKWKEFSSTLNELLAAEEHSEAVEFFLKFVGTPENAVTEMKASPVWKNMEAMAPTLAYDVAVVGEDRLIPVERVAAIKSPTLVMDGGASVEAMPFMRVTADKLGELIPNAQRRTLEGQGHGASPKIVAPVLIEFFK